MADAEMQILISIQDKVTEGFNKIQNTLEQGNKRIVQTTEQTTKSFEDQIGTLIAVGNIAASVDRIWDSYENLQLRLENASIRVFEAQKNVRDAQYALNKVMKDGKSTVEDVAKAQDDLETASNRVTTAQNNLQRTQNKVIGTYISMGVQGLQLVVSLVQLSKALQGTAIATAILEGITNPLYLSIGLAAAAAGVATIMYLSNKDALDAGVPSVDSYTSSQSVMGSVVSTSNVALQSQSGYIADVGTAINENLSLVEKWEYIQAYEAQNRVISEEEKQKAVEETRKKQDEALVNWAKYSVGTTTQINENWKEHYDSIKLLSKSWADYLIADADRIQAKYNEITGVSKKGASMKTVYGTTFNPNNFNESQFKSEADYQQAKLKAGYGDFISRPGQAPIAFSSDDTIIGTKSGMTGGISITITGDNYGVDADEIAEALIDKLRRKISI